jgi:hypothetical protein
MMIEAAPTTPARGGHDREVTKHRAAHDAHPGQQLEVRKPLAAARDGATDVGQHEPDRDGHRRAVNPASCERVRQEIGQPDEHADEHEGDDQTVGRQGVDERLVDHFGFPSPT